MIGKQVLGLVDPKFFGGSRQESSVRRHGYGVLEQPCEARLRVGVSVYAVSERRGSETGK